MNETATIERARNQAVVTPLLRESAPAGADVEIDLWSAGPPGMIPPDSAAIRLGQDAFERALGVRPLLLRSGGSAVYTARHL